MLRFSSTLLLALLATVLAAGAAAQPASLPPDGPDTDDLSVSAALDLVEAYGLDAREAVWVVRRAGWSGTPSSLPALDRIAATYADLSDLVAFNALWAQADLGRSTAHFETLVRAWASSPALAAQALLVAAAAPSADFAAYVEAMAPDDDALDHARARYLAVYDAQEELALLPLDEQLESLLLEWANIVGSCDGAEAAPDGYPYPFWTAFGSPGGELDPDVQWARRRFEALASSFPDAAAAVLGGITEDGVLGEACGDETGADRVAAFDAYVTETALAAGPGGGRFCDGRPATVYVASDGLIVGGRLDGQPFAGTLEGSNGSDVIVGTGGADTLLGFQGADLVCGLGGDDVLAGGNGRDTLRGGPGDDTLRGDNGPDTLLGEAGTDTADGGRGPDVCQAETERQCEADPDAHLAALTDVRPLVECVAEAPDGTLTAFFGYENLDGVRGHIARGMANRLAPAAFDGAQPEVFEMPGAVPGRPGRTPVYPGHAFSVPLPTGQPVVWTLLGRTAEASDTPSQRCAD